MIGGLSPTWGWWNFLGSCKIKKFPSLAWPGVPSPDLSSADTLIRALTITHAPCIGVCTFIHNRALGGCTMYMLCAILSWNEAAWETILWQIRMMMRAYQEMFVELPNWLKPVFGMCFKSISIGSSISLCICICICNCNCIFICICICIFICICICICIYKSWSGLKKSEGMQELQVRRWEQTRMCLHFHSHLDFWYYLFFILVWIFNNFYFSQEVPTTQHHLCGSTLCGCCGFAGFMFKPFKTPHLNGNALCSRVA